MRVAAFENSRLRLIQKNLRLSIFATPLIAVLTGSLFLPWTPLPEIAAWAIVYTAVSLSTMIAVKRLSTDAGNPAVVARKLWACGALTGIGALPWAALPFLFGSSGGAVTRDICIMLEAAAIPYVMATSSASIRVYGLHATPLVAALILGPLQNPDDLSLNLAGLAAVYSIVMCGVALQLHTLLTNMFEAKESNISLLEQLAQAKSESDAARVRAERSNQAKSTFLAKMSHELRTPLNAILGFSEVIKAELLGPIGTPLYKDYAGDIHASGKHLLGLINDILDLSRIEAGRVDLHIVTLSIQELVDDACRFVAPQAEKARVKLAKQVSKDTPHIRGDERALRQVLLNLLSNAVKFTPVGGTITVTSHRGSSVFGPSGITLSVTDTGIGIKSEDLPIVLEAFGQARIDDTALRDARDHGTGLGLPIVRGLLEAHGAQFELRSEFGKGTTAIAHLPKSCAVETQPALAAAG